MAATGDQVLTFRVGEAELAARVTDIRQVFRDAKVTRVPLAPPSLTGVASLRGAIVPVVSVAKLMGLADAPRGPDTRLVLLDLADPVAIVVDAVGALDRLHRADSPASEKAALGGFYRREDGSLRLVDLPALLRADFRGEHAAGPSRAVAVEPGARLAEPPQMAIVTFDLAGQAYGIPLQEVAEVLAAPRGLAALPRTDAAMAGVLPLRESLIPIVSLRALLGLGAAPVSARERIVVVRIGDARVGLLVDHLRSILRVAADRLEPTPPVLNRGAGEGRIESLLRQPDGRGLVSILDPERVFRDETLAQIVADGRQKGETMQEADTAAQAKIVVFRLGTEEYGLPIAEVDEILRLPDVLTRVPKAPPFVLGVMNLRGRLLPVVDQRQRFGTPGPTPAAGRRVIVATLGDRQAGFVVDAVSEILALPAASLAPTSPLAGEGGQMFDRMANLEIEGRIILVVDPQALLDRAERDLLRALDESAHGSDGP